MKKELLLIFTKNPELGKVKTRLAASVGDQIALDIYNFLLNHTHKITQNLSCEKAVYYSDKVDYNDMWKENEYQKYQQKGAGLGERMQHAFTNSFKNGYKKVVIIGSDIFELHSYHIDEAFKKLDTNDVVVGPAKDGGYYLLATKILHPKLFKNKNWGTTTVLKNTMQNLSKVNVHLLEELNDIDIIEDIENHPTFAHFLN